MKFNHLEKSICMKCRNEKSICIKCRNDNAEIVFYQWGEEDDILWEKGEVICPSEVCSADSDESTKEDCPYLLEHILATGSQ